MKKIVISKTATEDNAIVSSCDCTSFIDSEAPGRSRCEECGANITEDPSSELSDLTRETWYELVELEEKIRKETIRLNELKYQFSLLNKLI